MLVPVLLSGGVGSRLWPVSRAARPKQFLPLGGEGSMLQETLRRLQGLDSQPPVVVCNAEHRFMVAEQLRGESTASPEIILEPAGRNTAPAIALAALHLSKTHPESLLLVLPADHHIVEPARFRDAVMWAAAILVVALVDEKESAIPILVVLATLSLGILNKPDKPDS